MTKRHPREFAHMDLVGRLPAPADPSGPECCQIEHGVAVRTAAEINPDIRSTGIGIQIADPGWVTKVTSAVDQARIGNQAVSCPARDNGQGTILESPPEPECDIPIGFGRPLALGFNLMQEPGKMNQERILSTKEVFHYGF